MVVYSKFMKFRHRDNMLGMVNWRGDERVLDVGTGAGLLLIGAAKKLNTGKATGVDVWSTVDLRVTQASEPRATQRLRE